MRPLARPIIREVARRRGLSVADVTGKSRLQEHVEARLEIIARLRAIDLNLSHIARLLNRDRSTIAHHVFPDYKRRANARAMAAIRRKRAQGVAIGDPRACGMMYANQVI